MTTKNASPLQRRKITTGGIVTAIVVLAIYIGVFVAEQMIPPTSMIFTVL